MIHTQDADFTLLQGDVLDELAGLPDGSVHCVVTSPPYWGLRDYSSVGQIGLEPTPELYVARIVEVFREVRRVLRADGTCWVNLGDSYATERGRNDTSAADRARMSKDYGAGQGAGIVPVNVERKALRHPTKQKDLVGIPWRVAFALQTDGWYLRSDIIWAKPNPMPESVTDRPTKSHEYVFLLTRSPRYYFDQEAVREAYQGYDGRTKTEISGASQNGERAHENYANREGHDRWPGTGRNVRSVWDIPTQPYPEAHFATYPEELVRRCVLAGSSEHGCCPVCGKPWEREVERERIVSPPEHPHAYMEASSALAGCRDQNFSSNGGGRTNVTTLGWRPGCDHNRPPQPCVILDPFLGSGTTAYVARKHGRKSIGIELNPEYANLAARRMAQQSLEFV